MRAVGIWVKNYRLVVDNDRGHSVVVDLPKERGGDNSGATPSELTVMGLAGCLAITFKIVADKRRLSYKAIRITLDAERKEDAPTISKVNGLVEVSTDADEKEVQTTLNAALRSCTVGALFRKAGVEMNFKLVVNKS
jgi:putative redox protein